jgi:hypothetical protein
MNHRGTEAQRKAREWMMGSGRELISSLVFLGDSGVDPL